MVNFSAFLWVVDGFDETVVLVVGSDRTVL